MSQTSMRIGAGAVALVAIGFLAFAIWKQFGPASSGTAAAEYTCESCGNAWHGENTVGPKCPKCQAPGFTRAWFMCPECQHVFQGLEAKRVGEYETQYRHPGEKEWTGQPSGLTCPQCKKPFTDLMSSMVGQGWNAPPADKLPKAPRRVQ
jgi:hypothetical protein